jgi:preprotein translocase subunit SecA
MNFLDRIYTRIFGDFNQKYIQSLLPTVARIREKSEEFSSLSLEDLQKKTHEFVSRLESSETVDDILEEAFAVVISACRILTETKKEFILGNAPQVWNMIPFDVQILGGIVLHQGKIAEMKTGEGKTLVSTFAIYLNALCKKGVHVVTVNDYLAERDAQWMGVLYSALGLSVGVIKHGQRPEQKQEAYNCDITYGTNNEFGFDYLRDNMAGSPDQQMMREKFFAVIDEVDSILIDEARTPLIISSPAEESTQKYIEYSKLVRSLQKDTHYKLDEKERAVTLTEEGIQFLENRMGIDNIYTEKGFDTVHHLESALKAQSLFERDKDYIVQND